MRKNTRTFVRIFCRRPFTVLKAHDERPRNGTVLLPFFFARCSSSASPNFCNLLAGGRPSTIRDAGAYSLRYDWLPALYSSGCRSGANCFRWDNGTAPYTRYKKSGYRFHDNRLISFGGCELSRSLRMSVTQVENANL